MKDHEAETTYEVHYQKRGSSDWIVFTNHRYEQPAGSGWDATYHLPDAIEAAHELMDGTQHTDKRPEHRVRPTATRVVQRISMGGVLFALGEPARGE
jgi:hypothetical protein